MGMRVPWYRTGPPSPLPTTARSSILVDPSAVLEHPSMSTEPKPPVQRGESLWMPPCILTILPTGRNIWILISFVFVMVIPEMEIGIGETPSQTAAPPTPAKIFRYSTVGCTTPSFMRQLCRHLSLEHRRMPDWWMTLVVCWHQAFPTTIILVAG